MAGYPMLKTILDPSPAVSDVTWEALKQICTSEDEKLTPEKVGLFLMPRGSANTIIK